LTLFAKRIDAGCEWIRNLISSIPTPAAQQNLALHYFFSHSSNFRQVFDKF